MSCGYRRLQGLCMIWFYFQFLTFKNVKNYPQNSRKKVSNSSKKRQTPANPEKSYNQIFDNPPDYIIDCKPYMTNARSLKNSLQLSEFWTTRKHEMLEIFRKRMLQVSTYIIIYLQ